MMEITTENGIELKNIPKNIQEYIIKNFWMGVALGGLGVIAVMLIIKDVSLIVASVTG